MLIIIWIKAANNKYAYKFNMLIIIITNEQMLVIISYSINNLVFHSIPTLMIQGSS